MKTLKKIFPKALCLILAVIILFYAIPGNIYADTVDALTFESSSEEATASVSGSGTAYTYEGQAYEVEALREPSVKHFHLKDGTYVAAQYEYPVHEVDESGVLVDIDNELISSGNVFQNKNSRIKFAKKTTGNGTLFTLHDGSTKISFSLNGAAVGVAGSVTNGSDAEEETELQKMMNLEKLSASIIYREVLPGVDLEYIASSRNIKENIIVKERSDSYSYSFELALNGLSAALSSGGDIVIKNSKTDATQYVIPSPVVFDANGEYAADEHSSYVLADNGNGKYTLYVTVSSEWMNSEERAFPVTVDPTVYENWDEMITVYVDEVFPTINFSHTNEMIVGYNFTGYWKCNNLPTLPGGAYLSSAKLFLYNDLPLSDGMTSDARVGAYQVTSYWDSSLCYNDTQLAENPEGTLATWALDYNYVTTEKFYAWDITKAVKAWYDTPTVNYGIGFKSLDQTFDICEFSSVNAPNSPVFSVSYVNMDGVEDYWSYSSHSAGVAGIGSINLANGNLSIAVPTLSTTDSLMPYTPTLVYNSSLAGKAYCYANTESTYSGTYAGLGFKLNICETIIAKSYTDASGNTKTYYVYDDADGTKHAFYESNTAGVFVDEDGMQKSLRLTSDGSIVITDDSKQVRTFSKRNNNPSSEVSGAWYLTKITDESGNQIVFAFDSGLRPIKVSLIPKLSSQIDFLTITHYSDGRLKMIYNPSSRDAVIFRYSATYNGEFSQTTTKYLRRIDYAVGNSSVTDANWEAFINSASNITNISIKSSALYSYSSDGRIMEIGDTAADQRMRYSYNASGEVSSVLQLAGSERGGSVSYYYGMGYTDVITSGADDKSGTDDDITTRYNFDRLGRSVGICSYDYESGEIYGATVGKYETQENVKNNLKEQTVLGGVSVNYLLNGDFEKREADGSFSYWTQSGAVTKTDEFLSSEGAASASFKPVSGATASISQCVFLDEGNYTFSMQYISQNADNVTGRVSIKSILGSQIDHSEEISLNKTVATGIEAVFSTTFTVGDYLDGGDKLRITVEFTAGESDSTAPTIEIDKLMLENSVGASSYSLVSYGDFEAGVLNSAGNIIDPSAYWETEGGLASRISSGFHGKGVRVNADIDSEKYVKQRVYEIPETELYLYDNNRLDFYTNAKHEYTVSGMAYSQLATASQNSTFRLRVDVIYYQGTGEADVTVSHYFNFLPFCEDWQFIAGRFSTVYVPTDEDDQKDYSCVRAIDVYCEFSYQPLGHAFFDKIALVNANQTSFERFSYYGEEDEKRSGLLAVKENLFYREYYEYDDNRNLIRIANNRGELTDYTYTETNHVSTETEYSFTCGNGYDYPFYYDDPEAAIEKTPIKQTAYIYNDYGLPVESLTSLVDEDLEPVAGEKKIYHNSSYYTNSGSKIFGALKSEWDSANVNTRYYYDTSNGRLLAKINKSSNSGTAYTYDIMGRLVEVLPAVFDSTNGYSEILDGESVTYTYNERDLLEAIITETTTYLLDYDVFGNTSSVSIGSNDIVSYEYNERNGKLIAINYANGNSEEYVYNSVELLKEIWYNNTESGVRKRAYEYEYTASGQLYKFIDNINGKTTVYKYDTNGRLTDLAEYDSDDPYHDFSAEIHYNSRGELYSTYYDLNYLNGNALDVNEWSYRYTYRTDGLLRSVNVTTAASGVNENYTYDSYDRVSKKTVSSAAFLNETLYTYRSVGEFTSSWIETYTSKVNGTATATCTYTYDNNGNITKITYANGTEIRYVYDGIGQLIREDNGVLGETYVYEYDNVGNIKSKKRYTLTAANATPVTQLDYSIYTYSTGAWGDVLISLGRDMSYDELGNPIYYANGYAEYDFEWTGTKLTGASSQMGICSFTYNDEGIRTGKIYDGVITTYYLNGSQIVAEETSGNVTLYIYDSEGLPIGMQYHGAAYGEDVWDVYWFEKNIFGDIVAVYNNTGTLLIEYKYNAFGEFKIVGHNGGLSSTASKNPFRYRGYYYDRNIDLYYLGARYYDAHTGRFISPDNVDVVGATPTALTDKNLYAYCDNNPIMRRDDGGQFWDTVFDVVSLVGSVVDVCTNPSDPWAWVGLVGDVVDLIPFVSLAGETVRAIRAADTALDTVDTLNDARKASKKSLDAIESAAENLNKGDNFVYISLGEDGIIEYVGITNDFDRRAREWANKGRKIIPYIDCLDRKSARIVEQTVIETFGIGKNGGRLVNKINSISTKNPLYEAVKAFRKMIK